MSSSLHDIDRKLKQIAHDTMLIAVVLILAASLLELPLLGGLTRGYWVASGATIILLAPGVWYAYASRTLRHASGPVVKWTMLVAVGQLSACVIAIPIARFVTPEFAIAAVILLFFLPALLVLLIQLWRARHLIRMREAVRGFAVSSLGEEIVGSAEVVTDAQRHDQVGDDRDTAQEE